MKCDLIDIESFVAVVRHGGFTAAARATHREKAQLSRRVARLEKTLGTPLLLRTTRRIGLTEAGENFYQQASQGLTQLETAQNGVLQLLGEPAGVVRIAAPTFIAQTYLTPLAQRFMEDHPDVQIHLEATDKPVNLLTERVDIVFRVRPVIEDTADAVARLIINVQRYAVAAPRLLASYAEPTNPQDLATLPVIAYPGDKRGDQASWRLTQDGQRFEHFTVQPRFVCNDMRAHLEATLAGAGIGLLPDVIVDELVATGTLKRLLDEWSTGPELLHLLHARPSQLLPATRRLIDFLLAELPAVIRDSRVDILGRADRTNR